MKAVINLIYFIHSNDSSWLNQRIEKIQSTLNIKQITPIVFSGSYSFDEMMLEIETPSFFEEKKFIIIKNLPGFNTTKVMADDQFQYIKQLLENPPIDVDLVFSLDGNKPDGKRKLTKLFKKLTNFIIHEGLDATDITSLIKHYINQYQLSVTSEGFSLLNSFCLTQTDVNMAFEKLSLIDKPITKDVVLSLVNDQRESMIYELSEALIKRDAKRVFSIYDMLIRQDFQPIQLLYLLANKYRQYYQLFTLNKAGYSPQEIAKTLKMSDRQAYFLINNHQNLISTKECLIQLRNLAQLDQEAKRGSQDFKRGLELFMIKVLT